MPATFLEDRLDIARSLQGKTGRGDVPEVHLYVAGAYQTDGNLLCVETLHIEIA